MSERITLTKVYGEICTLTNEVKNININFENHRKEEKECYDSYDKSFADIHNRLEAVEERPGKFAVRGWAYIVGILAVVIAGFIGGIITKAIDKPPVQAVAVERPIERGSMIRSN